MPHRVIMTLAALLTLSFAPAWAAGPRGGTGPVDWQKTPLRLMMVERDGCIYCEAWDREIGPDYAASATGRTVPLMRVDIDGPYPDGLALARRPTITPTFILLRQGLELERLEGYPGPRYFHPVMAEIMARAGIKPR